MRLLIHIKLPIESQSLALDTEQRSSLNTGLENFHINSKAKLRVMREKTLAGPCVCAHWIRGLSIYPASLFSNAASKQQQLGGGGRLGELEDGTHWPRCWCPPVYTDTEFLYMGPPFLSWPGEVSKGIYANWEFWKLKTKDLNTE